MHNKGVHMNGSQFLIQYRDKLEYFDEKHICFGRVISGWDFIEKIHEVPREEEKPKRPVIIVKCGELRFEDKLLVGQADFLENYDRDVYVEDRAREVKRQAKRKAREEREAQEKAVQDAKDAIEKAEREAKEALEAKDKPADAEAPDNKEATKPDQETASAPEEKKSKDDKEAEQQEKEDKTEANKENEDENKEEAKAEEAKW